MSFSYYVYIMANKKRMTYIGVTNNLERRVYEHKSKGSTSYSNRYNLTRLVWYEETNDVTAAIAFEKKMKGWVRKKKVALINEMNPKWHDLAEEWFDI